MTLIPSHLGATAPPRETLRILIADDEPDARLKVRRLIKETPHAVVVGEARNGLEAITAITSLRPDAIFLDVRMPDLDGFGVVEALVGMPAGPKVVFVTAYDEYAVRAFEVRALDYILKPFDADRMAEALRRVRQQLEYEHRPSPASLRSLLGAVRDLDEATPETKPAMTAPSYLDRVCIRSLGRTQFLRTADIEWVEAYGNYVRLHTHTGRALMRQPLRRFAEQLDPNAFCRIHRSAVINLSCLEEMRPCETGDYIVQLRSGVRLKLSRIYRAELDRRLGRKK